MYWTQTGNLTQRVSVRVLLFIGVFSVGCDPVTRVEQSLVLKVASVDEAVPEPSASVAIREYHQPSKEDDEFEQFNPQRREQMYPWTEDVKTDKSGRATIVYGVTMLDRSDGNAPPMACSPLGGRVFTVRIRGADGETEELNLKMSAGTTTQGRSHRITVEEITKAVYVDPN